MIRLWAATLLIFISAQGISAQSAQGGQTYPLCERWVAVDHPLKPGLSDLEKRLVCGDPKAAQAWRTIPFSQAQFNLTNFLQDRGYYHPTIQRGSLPDPHVTVKLGEPTRVTQIDVQGNEGGWIDISRKRKVKGEILTPLLLNTLEKWAYERLRTQGFACPEVESAANPDTGEVLLKLHPGAQQNIVEVSEEAIPGTDLDVPRRYDAFRIGRQFNGELLTVTENRVTSAGIVESNHISSRCQPDGVYLKHEFVAGPPHILTAGAGINTEGLLLARISWRNIRMGSYASLLDLSLSASTVTQTLSNQLSWYVFPHVIRAYLNPLFQLTHRNLTPFEDVSARVQFGAATTGEFSQSGATYFLGPTLDYYTLVRGTGPPNSHLLSLEGRVTWRTHRYEYYLSDPQQGFQLAVVGDLNSKSLYSDISAQRLNFTGESLWNLGGFDPPLWIIGLRGGVSALITQEKLGPQTIIPVSLLKFLGGSRDLRGFGLQELPIGSPTGTGGLTSAFLGLELRLSHTLPARVDPFIFGDVGVLGFSSVSLDLPVYWSPGFGLRWGSPIGPLRTTLAHGFSNATPLHWQFFFSLGEEF